MAAQQDNSNDDDDLPVKYQPPKDRAAKKAESQAKLHELLSKVGDKISDAGDAVGGWLGKHATGNAGGAMSDAPAVSDDEQPDEPAPIQYTHSGDAANMGPPSSLKQPTTDGSFRPTPSGKGYQGPPASVVGLPEKAAGENYERTKDAIKGVESSGRYDAVNKDPKNPNDKGALGAYQFRPGQWDKWTQQNFGHSVADMIPQKGDSPDEVKRKEQEQDRVFAKYYEDQMVPWIKQTRADGLGKDKSDVELAALFHNQGGPKAEEILQGKAPEPTDYVQQVAAAAGVKGQVQWGNSMAGRNQRPGSASDTASSSPDSSSSSRGKPNPAIDWNSLGGDHLDSLKNNSDPNIRTATYDFQKAKDALAAGNNDDFAKELKKLNDNFDETKDSIAKRELAHTIADALTKMGAGLMGMKTKVDMSHINIGDHDFQKDTQLAQNEYKMKADDLKARREESLRAKEGAVDMGFKEAQLGQNADEMRHRANVDKARLTIEDLRNQAMDSERQANLQFHQDEEKWRMLDRGEDRERKIQEANDRRQQTAVDSAAKILASKEIGKDEDRASAAMIALRPLHIDPVALHDAFYKDGFFFGENVRSIDDISKRLNTLASESAGHPQQSFTASRPDGKKVIFSTQAQAQAAQREYDKQKVQ